MCLNTCFQFSNNITHIFTYFYAHTDFQKIYTILIEQSYQMRLILTPRHF